MLDSHSKMSFPKDVFTAKTIEECVDYVLGGKDQAAPMPNTLAFTALIASCLAVYKLTDAQKKRIEKPPSHFIYKPKLVLTGDPADPNRAVYSCHMEQVCRLLPRRGNAPGKPRFALQRSRLISGHCMSLRS